METSINDKKFYVPSIEEFHVGFEYEFNCPTGKKGESEWKKEVYDKRKWFHSNSGISYEWLIKEGDIRVKYLDKSDIESLVHTNAEDFHTIFKLRNKYTDELVFQTYWVEEDEFLDEEYIYWNIKYNTFKITHKSKTLFRGTIKNKSELKRVLKQIGIDHVGTN